MERRGEQVVKRSKEEEGGKDRSQTGSKRLAPRSTVTSQRAARLWRLLNCWDPPEHQCSFLGEPAAKIGDRFSSLA